MHPAGVARHVAYMRIDEFRILHETYSAKYGVLNGKHDIGQV